MKKIEEELKIKEGKWNLIRIRPLRLTRKKKVNNKISHSNLLRNKEIFITNKLLRIKIFIINNPFKINKVLIKNKLLKRDIIFNYQQKIFLNNNKMICFKINIKEEYKI